MKTTKMTDQRLPSKRNTTLVNGPVPKSMQNGKTASGRGGCSCGGSCRRCKGKPIQFKLVADREPVTDPVLPNQIMSTGGGASIDDGTRARLEQSFGRDLSNVRVHNNGDANRAASSLGARAFTLGNNIWFGKNQYRPGTAGGLRLLAHEVAHTVQQRGAGTGLQRKTLIGNANDPAESRADRAAEAVVQGRQAPDPGSSTPVIRRSCDSVNGNTAEITMPSGSRYRVTRTFRLVPITERSNLPPEIELNYNLNDVWIALGWCTSGNQTRGRVQLSANIPAELRRVLQDAIGQAIGGGSRTDVLDVLAGARITPNLSFTITRSESFEIGANVGVTIGRQGVVGGSGGLTVRFDSVEIGLNASGTRTGGSLNLTFRLRTRPDRVECPTREVVVVHPRPVYSCERHQTRQVTRMRDEQRTLTRTHYFYYNYAQSTFNNALMGVDGSTPLNATSQAAVSRELRDGFRISGIHGFTSPEGPQDPTARYTRTGGRRGFQGNDRLAHERARAALARVRPLCPVLDEGQCFTEDPDVITTGQGELYGSALDQGGPRELTGRELERHAVRNFLVQTEEDPHRGLASEQLGRARTSREEAQAVYPYMRRAVVTLAKQITEQVPVTEDVTGFFPERNCPDEVLVQAERCFRNTPTRRSGN